MSLPEAVDAFSVHLDFPKVLYENTDLMTRVEWLDARRKGIGGSDAAAACGLSPWKSPYTLWCEKTGEYVSDPGSEAARWGQLLEDVVAEEFARREDLRVVPFPVLLSHPDHPWMLANVDRLVVDENGEACALLECKTTSLWLEDEWEGEDFPDHHAMQVHHYLAVTGLPRAYVAVLIGGQRMPEPRTVERDEQMIADLVKIEGEFWKLVESRVAPALDGSDSTRDTLRARYGEVTPEKSVEVPPEVVSAIRRRRALRDEMKRLDEEARRCEAEVMAALADAEVGTYAGETVCTWKEVSTKEHMVKASSHRRLYVPKEAVA